MAVLSDDHVGRKRYMTGLYDRFCINSSSEDLQLHAKHLPNEDTTRHCVELLSSRHWHNNSKHQHIVLPQQVQAT